MSNDHASPHLGDVEFWRLRTVLQKVGLSKSEVYRQMASGTFPKSRRYAGSGTRGTFWLSRDILLWQEEQLWDAEHPE